MGAYIGFTYIFVGVLCLIGGALGLLLIYDEVNPGSGPTKQQRKDIRLCWYGVIGALVAPLTAAVAMVVAPFALCYGVYRLVKGPVRRSLNDAFGRQCE